MSNQYQRIFEIRGSDYDRAMQLFPRARDAEFRALLDKVDRNAIGTVADIPSAGGYLQFHLPSGAQIDSLEPCDEFKTHQHGSGIDLENLHIRANHYDLIISLAAVHHVSNKELFIQRCYESLKPKGYLCLGDVAANHAIGRFLDEFAGLHNGTGHNGDYLDIDNSLLMAEQQGFNILEAKIKPCPWRFANHADMLQFCGYLFSIHKLPDKLLLEALGHYVGISADHRGVQLNWELLYISLQKN